MELTVLKNNYYGIPQELKEKKQWLLSDIRQNKKIPCNLQGIPTDATNEKNWYTFNEILPRLGQDFKPAFCLNNDYAVMDLDQCIDNNELKPWAVNALKDGKDCYIEYSYSGKGLHLIFNITDNFKGKKGVNIKLNKMHPSFKDENPKSGIELYFNKKAFLLTGNIFNGKKEIKQDAFCLTNLYNMLNESKQKENKKYHSTATKQKNNIFEDVREALNITDIIQHYGLKVNRNKCNCPFHGEKEASFSIYPLTNSYYCFGCQTGGDLIDFVARYEKITQLEAVNQLIEKFNLNIEIKDKNIDLDLEPVKWNPNFVWVEWVDILNGKQKERLSKYFEIFNNVEPEQRPKIQKYSVQAVEENTTALLDHYSLDIKYNVLKMEYEVFNNNVYECILENKYFDIKNKCIKHGLNIDKMHLIDNLVGIGQKNKYNPWQEYLLKSHEYYLKNPDKNIFEKLLNTIVSNTAWKRKYIGKFLLQMITIGCSQDESDLNADYMLVLHGKQQIGKTTWMKNLLPSQLQPNYFLSGRSLDLDNKDNIMETVSNVLVEIGEISATFRKSDQEALKNFITSIRDKFRIPYAKSAITQKRRTSLCGTTNDYEYLRDLTGTRRYLTLNCQSFDKETKIDIDMLWGYIYSLFLAGMSYKFTDKEVEYIIKDNESYLNKPEKLLILEETFDLHPNDDDGEWYRAKEIIDKLGELPPGCKLNKFTIGKELKACNVKIHHIMKENKLEYFLRLL